MEGRSVFLLRRKIETGSFPFSGREVTWRHNKKDDVLRLRISENPIARTVETEIGLADLDENDDLVQIVVYHVTRVMDDLEKAGWKLPEHASMTDDLTHAVSAYVHGARDEVRSHA